MTVICVIFSLARRTTLESLFLNASLLFPQKLYFHGMSHMSNHVNYCALPYVRVREIFIVLTSYYSFSVRHLKRYVNTQSSLNTSWHHSKSKNKFYIWFKSSGCFSCVSCKFGWYEDHFCINYSVSHKAMRRTLALLCWNLF